MRSSETFGHWRNDLFYRGTRMAKCCSRSHRQPRDGFSVSGRRSSASRPTVESLSTMPPIRSTLGTTTSMPTPRPDRGHRAAFERPLRDQAAARARQSSALLFKVPLSRLFRPISCRRCACRRRRYEHSWFPDCAPNRHIRSRAAALSRRRRSMPLSTALRTSGSRSRIISRISRRFRRRRPRSTITCHFAGCRGPGAQSDEQILDALHSFLVIASASRDDPRQSSKAPSRSRRRSMRATPGPSVRASTCADPRHHRGRATARQSIVRCSALAGLRLASAALPGSARLRRRVERGDQLIAPAGKPPSPDCSAISPILDHREHWRHRSGCGAAPCASSRARPRRVARASRRGKSKKPQLPLTV